MHWNVFCRVIDNHGDIGMCWRLSAQLGALGHAVTLWVDDPSALHWMAPTGARGVTVQPWSPDLPPSAQQAPFRLGDVVVEAFGCRLPPWVEAAIAAAQPAPAWINLEYLSAEPYALRSHGLASPVMHGPAQGLRKYFYYPGFEPRSGGLLREADLADRQSQFDPEAWLAGQGVRRRRGERVASLFCYPQAHLAAWLTHLVQDRPATHVMVTPGHAQDQVGRWLGEPFAPGASVVRGSVHLHALAWLTQGEYDHLLWCCDLNLVRGEDSLVRALWAAKPLLWQLYPQDDGAHRAKLDAFLAWAWPQREHDSAPLWRAWNGWPGDAPLRPQDWDTLWQGLPTPRVDPATGPGLADRLVAFARRHPARPG